MSTYSDLRIDDARGAHFGDNIYNVYAGGKTWDPGENFNFDDYVEATIERLREAASKHVVLDLEPMVVAVDRELRPAAATARVTDILKSDKPAAILGTAGSGKSASLRYLAAECSHHELRIYIELARYRKDSRYSPIDSLLVLIGEIVNNWAGGDAPPSLPLLRRIIKDKKRPVVLLLDGLNEVEATVRDECLRGILDLIDSYHCRVVLGTRPHGFTPPAGWNIFRLREMNEQQVQMFLEAEADERTRMIIQRSLDLEDNPLLRLPLFLKYVITLIRESGSTEALPRSRTAIVSRYTRELLNRDGEIDHDLNAELLSVLAIELQKVGQSLPRDEAEQLLARHFKRDAEWADGQLSMLAKRGLLAIDERYVRFFHHTIQEYFYAGGKRRAFFPEKGAPRLILMARELRRRSQEDALAFVAADATDAQMKTLLRVASRTNMSLGMRWADDLSTGKRAPEAIDFFLSRVQRRLDAIAVYSRLTYAPRRLVAFVVMLVAASIAYAAYIDVVKADDGLWLLNVCVLGVIIAIVAGHLLATYPGCDPAAEIFATVRNLRSSELRAAMEKQARAVMKNSFASFELRQLAASVIDTDFDPLDLAVMPYIRIQLLGFSEDERAPAILQAVAEAAQGNVYSRIALQTMHRRAIRNRGEVERATKLASEVWNNTNLEWTYRCVAARCLRDLDPQFGTSSRSAMIARIALYSTLALVFVTGWTFAAFLLGITSEGISLLFLPPLVGGLIALVARMLGAKRVRGYYGGDGWHPLYYCLSATVLGFFTLTAIPVALFVFHLRRIRLNARGLDAGLVRKLVESNFAGVHQETT